MRFALAKIAIIAKVARQNVHGFGEPFSRLFVKDQLQIPNAKIDKLLAVKRRSAKINFERAVLLLFVRRRSRMSVVLEEHPDCLVDNLVG